MDMYDLQAFLAVVQKGNFSRAAAGLALTQPALSQRIKQLESELGYPLLIRKKGCQAIVLTEHGYEFLEIAKQMLTLWDSAKGLSPEENIRERLNVSIIDSVMTCTIPAVVHQFLHTYPDTELAVSSYHSLESYHHVERGDLDMAIVGKLSRAQGAITYPLYSDPWVFICGKDAHYPDIVHPTDLNTDFQLLLCNKEADDWQEYWFSSSGMQLAGARKISYVNRYLFEGETWAVLPSTIAHYLEKSANGVIHKIKDGPSPRIIYMVQSSRANARAVKKFKDCVYQELRKNPDITLMFQPDEA